MNLNTLSAHLVTMTGHPAGEFSELQRALKEGSVHFDELNEKSDIRPEIERDEARLASQLVGKAGPRGGILADPFHTAFFVLAFMLNGPRARSAETTWSAWHLPTVGSILSGSGENFQPTFVKCALTKSILFGEAFKVILANEDLARRVDRIEVSMSNHLARIYFDHGTVSSFEEMRRRPLNYFDRTATLSGDAVSIISELITRP